MSVLPREGAAGSAAGGAALFAAAAAWWLIAGAGAGAPTAWAIGLIAGAAATVGVAWAAAARRPAMALAGLAGVATAVLVADAGTTLRPGPQQGPFGYANATAAFFGQALVAGLLLVVVGRRSPRILGAATAAVILPVLLVTRSFTALIALPLALVAALVVERFRGGRAAVMACGVLFAAVLVATLALGAWGFRTGSDPLDRVVGSTISEERVALWNEALTIAAEHPLLGVGPGGFARASAIAQADPDLRWAHNEFLQAGAEAGLPGYVLSVGIFLWGFVALARRSPGRVAALAAAGLAALGVQASVDYVLHFPFVVLMGAAVLGVGLGATSAADAPPPIAAGEPLRAHA